MTKGYVFAADSAGNAVLAGALESDGSTGLFTYADTWLSLPWSYPLDPVNLPLSPKRYMLTNKNGVHGVFSDAGPDDWGTRVSLHNTSAPANELERLLRTSKGEVGCLRFSGARTQPKTPEPLPSLARITELVEIVERAQGRDALTEEELALIDLGSSMGGARPKVSCVDDAGNPWLVKLSRKRDVVGIPRLEYAAMTFCSQYLGINTPECRLLDLGNDQSAFMIRRFDEGTHFISAYSLINQDMARQQKDSKSNLHSYFNIATILRKHAANFEADCRELFRRMVANILMGMNDHARKQAMLFDIRRSQWGLSPACDMLPNIGGSVGSQALDFGKFGSKSTIEVAISSCNLFFLKAGEAKDIVDATLEAIAKIWDNHALAMGVLPVELQKINHHFQRQLMIHYDPRGK